MTDPMQTDLPNCPECGGSGKDGTPEGFACFPCNGTGKNLGVDHAPVAFAVFAPNGNIRLWSTDGEYVRRFAESHGVPLTPLYRASELRSLRDALELAKSRIAELEGASEGELIGKIRNLAAHASMYLQEKQYGFVGLALNDILDATEARAALKEDSE